MGVGDLSELYMSKEKVKLKQKCNRVRLGGGGFVVQDVLLKKYWK